MKRVYIIRIIYTFLLSLILIYIYRCLHYNVSGFQNLKQNDSNVKCITFGSHGEYIEAAERLIQQANNLNVFSETIVYTADDLKKDKAFWNKHGTFVNENKRGYGYWLWKPYIIKKQMETMKNNDILLYLDCGCEIDYKHRTKLIEYFNIVKDDKIIGTKTMIEKNWNKMDLIIKLNMKKDNYLNTPQHQAGAILFLVCDETRNLVNEWYELGSIYSNIDDSESKIQNLPGFIEHRHDQSIFSLLTKKYQLFSMRSLDEAVHYSRNRTGTSLIKD